MSAVKKTIYYHIFWTASLFLTSIFFILISSLPKLSNTYNDLITHVLKKKNYVPLSST